MVGIVIVTHGKMAEGLLDAARMIVGEQEGIVGVGLMECDDVESLIERVAQAVQEVETGDGTLILVDVFGASPFNASARLAMAGENPEVLTGARLAMAGGKLEVLTGVSLPMVLELAVQREGQSLQELVDLAREAGASGIKVLSETLAKTQR